MTLLFFHSVGVTWSHLRINVDYKILVKNLHLLAPLIKQLTEVALKAEVEVESHIANDVLSGTRNRRNSSNKKLSKVPVMVLLS